MQDETKAEYWKQYRETQGVKHELIRHYLNAWFPILCLGGNNEAVIYFDTHAGRGRHESGQEGSPLVALHALLDHRVRDKILKCSIVKSFFVEKEPEHEQRLRQELEQVGKDRRFSRDRIEIRLGFDDAFQLIESICADLDSKRARPYLSLVSNTIVRKEPHGPRCKILGLS